MFLYAQVYFLLRAGHYADAVDCLSSKANTLRTSDSALPAALKAWVENNQHLPEQHRIELRKTWDLDIRNKENVDQFRVALYKIIGRIDMAKKGVKVATSTEDWVWVNLMLTREGLEDSPVDRYTLKDFATVVAGLPRERYDQKGQKPLVWVNLLLQAGEFEEVGHIGTVGAAFEGVSADARPWRICTTRRNRERTRCTWRSCCSTMACCDWPIPTIRFVSRRHPHVTNRQDAD